MLKKMSVFWMLCTFISVHFDQYACDFDPEATREVVIDHSFKNDNSDDNSDDNSSFATAELASRDENQTPISDLFVSPFKREREFDKDYMRASAIPVQTMFATLTAWAQACQKLPKNRDNTPGYSSPFANLSEREQMSEFAGLVVKWMDMKFAELGQDNMWQSANDGAPSKPTQAFFDILTMPGFVPYAQKLIARPSDQFYFRGDLHGDIFSLLEQLNDMKDQDLIDDNFRIIDDNVRIIFLGDYVDRGKYGAEVMYTLFRLSLANPDRVILVRGNHEDACMQMALNVNYTAFNKELESKFKILGIYSLLARVYDLLPSVLFLGCANEDASQINFLQCCHGGIETGYDPGPFLDNRRTQYQRIGLLNRTALVHAIWKKCEDTTDLQKLERWNDNVERLFDIMDNNLLRQSCFLPHNLGYLWTDFDVSNKDQIKISDRGGSIMQFGEQATDDVLQEQSTQWSKIIGIFRGHQHSGKMIEQIIKCHGVYKAWHPDHEQQATYPYWRDVVRVTGSGQLKDHANVFTFTVGPDSSYGVEYNFEKDAYAVLVVAERLLDWKLQIFNTQVLPPVIRKRDTKN